MSARAKRQAVVDGTPSSSSHSSAGISSSPSSPPPLPPRHTYPPAPAQDSTLYDHSPHVKRDLTFRRRRERQSCGLDPLHVVVLIIAFGLSALYIWPFIFAPEYWYGSRLASPRSRTLRQRDQCVLPPDCKVEQHSQDAPFQQVSSTMVWQTTFTLPSNTKGCYLITKDVERACAEGIKGVKAGIISLTIQHTSAALSLNENYDSTVRSDMTMAMDRIVPESLPWKHVDEGPDDSASHTKASLFGATITLPITNGQFNLGTWQGIYLCEFRAAKHSRRVVATVLS